MIIDEVCYELRENIDFREMMDILLQCKYVIPEDDIGTYRLGTIVDGYQVIILDQGKIRLHRQNRRYFIRVDLKNQNVYRWLTIYLKLKTKNSHWWDVDAYLDIITTLKDVNVLKLMHGDLHTEYIISGSAIDCRDNFMLKLINGKVGYRMYAYGGSTHYDPMNTCYNYQVPDRIIDSLEVISEPGYSMDLKSI